MPRRSFAPALRAAGDRRARHRGRRARRSAAGCRALPLGGAVRTRRRSWRSKRPRIGRAPCRGRQRGGAARGVRGLPNRRCRTRRHRRPRGRGFGLLDVRTERAPKRLVGELGVRDEVLGTGLLVGFENHRGVSHTGARHDTARPPRARPRLRVRRRGVRAASSARICTDRCSRAIRRWPTCCSPSVLGPLERSPIPKRTRSAAAADRRGMQSMRRKRRSCAAAELRRGRVRGLAGFAVLAVAHRGGLLRLRGTGPAQTPPGPEPRLGGPPCGCARRGSSRGAWLRRRGGEAGSVRRRSGCRSGCRWLRSLMFMSIPNG